MGMFDYVRCEWPLPEGAPIDGYQTKDADCWPGMETYTITREGRLLHRVERYETVPEEQRPNFGTPRWDQGEFAQIAGSLRRVHEGDEEIPFHGALNFYTTDWHFVALFKRGELIDLSGGREED